MKSRFHPIAFLNVASVAVAIGCASAPREMPSFNPQLGVNLAAMTESGGVRYVDLAEGKGPVVRRGAQVYVYYNLWLANGKSIDSVRKPTTPLKFGFGRGEVISGWERGLEGMHAGGTRQIVIPPELAYGSKRMEGIPPNSTLVFLVDVVDVR